VQEKAATALSGKAAKSESGKTVVVGLFPTAARKVGALATIERKDVET
jgi:hypothetical protein